MSILDEKIAAAVAEEPVTPEPMSANDSAVIETDNDLARPASVQSSSQVPWGYKILSILLVSGIGFGSSWSSGVTGAMKTTLKKVRNINLKFRL